MPARGSSARPPVRAGELWPAAVGSGADELCPAAASVRAEELRHVRCGRRQAPPGRRERAPGELRPSRHGCAWRAAAPRPPQEQAQASSAWLGASTREGAPADRRGRRRALPGGALAYATLALTGPGARLTHASRGPARAPSSCHRGTSTSDAGDGVASFRPQVAHLNRSWT